MKQSMMQIHLVYLGHQFEHYNFSSVFDFLRYRRPLLWALRETVEVIDGVLK